MRINQFYYVEEYSLKAYIREVRLCLSTENLYKH